MDNLSRFYINGRWVTPSNNLSQAVINPASGRAIAKVSMGARSDVDAAVSAARACFDNGLMPVEDRINLFERIIAGYHERSEDLARAVSQEMGAPISLAREAHIPTGLKHLKCCLEVLRSYEFDQVVNETRITREPIGVCALITPWNWPLNQIACKVGPALATGCSVILKPSELAPLSSMIFAEILDTAGVPPGMFNLVNGDGSVVGDALARHEDVDMVSFTGSTGAGILVAKAAADTVKRVTQELGGKSPYIILDDADLLTAVRHAAQACFRNSGQSCNAPTRMLVPRNRLEDAQEIAADVAASLVVGDPFDEQTTLGPVANEAQYRKIIAMIRMGVDEGAQLVYGEIPSFRSDRPGYFVAPTVFSSVTPEMTIARHEIFGPVLSIIAYDSESQAIQIANDTVYGLSAYVSSGDADRARRVARQIRAGMVHINGGKSDTAAAFGGYKRSGNGREWGVHGFEEFLEVKSMFGYESA